MPPAVPIAIRLSVAGLVAAGGMVHLHLWQTGYRRLPTIGVLFLLQVVMSGIVAAALIVSADRRLVAFAMLGAVGALGALLVSRTVGLFGFMEGWTPDTMRAVAAEFGVLVAGAALLVSTSARNPPLLARVVR